MQKAAASLAVEVPYERASTLFGELMEVRLFVTGRGKAWMRNVLLHT